MLRDNGDDTDSNAPSRDSDKEIEDPPSVNATESSSDNAESGSGKRPGWRSIFFGAVKVAGGIAVIFAVQQLLSWHVFPPDKAAKSNHYTVNDAQRKKAPVVSKAGGIPLAEVVRYRERQWFKDELEAARLGDTGSMIRLAKLHLAGAGCSKDLEAARYWVRRARKSGAWVTLEELIFDGPDPPPLPKGVTRNEFLNPAGPWQQPSYPAPAGAMRAYNS